MRKIVICLHSLICDIEDDSDYLACTASAYISLLDKNITPFLIHDYIDQTALNILDSRLINLFQTSSIQTEQSFVSADDLSEYLCYLYGTLLLSKSLLAEYIYDILCHHYLVYDQNGNHIKSSHQLVNLFCNNLNLHPWFETNHTPGLFSSLQ